MSEGAWSPRPWEEAQDRSARLPHVADLPAVAGGYDADAVESAFAAFHDHAARLDRTLEVLETVSAFEQRAAELRADIRALRAAAWGPLPIPRSSWGAAYASRSAARSGSVPAALPRLAVEAAFIILVAVGAALAEVDTPVLVGLVLGAWVIVGLIEVVVASTRAQRRIPAPPPVAAGPLYVPAPRSIVLEETREEAVVFEPAPELEAALEYEPELAGEEDDEEDGDDSELPPAAAADPWADAGAEAQEGAPAETEPVDDEQTDEQVAIVSLVPEPEASEEPAEAQKDTEDGTDERGERARSFGLRRGRR